MLTLSPPTSFCLRQGTFYVDWPGYRDLQEYTASEIYVEAVDPAAKRIRRAPASPSGPASPACAGRGASRAAAEFQMKMEAASPSATGAKEATPPKDPEEAHRLLSRLRGVGAMVDAEEEF